MPWIIPGTSHAGTKLKLNGRLEEGFEHYRRAIAACPAYAPAFYNIGVIHSERRDFAAAKQYYERALQVPSLPSCSLPAPVMQCRVSA